MAPKPSRTSSTKIRCTCGCNKDVSYSTKQRHLRGQSKPEIAAVVLERSRGLRGESVDGADSSPNKRLRSESPNYDAEDQHQMQPFVLFPNAAEMTEAEPSAVPAIEPTAASSSPHRSAHVTLRARQTILDRWGDGLQLVRREEVGGEESEGGEGDEEERDEEGGMGEGGGYDNPENNLDHGTGIENQTDDDEEYRSQNSPDCSEETYWDWLDNNFWRNSPDDVLDDGDASLLRQYAFKVENHLTERTFEQLPRVFPGIPHHTLKNTKRRVRQLSGFQSKRYDCCINSCACYTGPYKDLTECPNCNEARSDARGRPRQVFEYLPLTPRLQAMSANAEHAKVMRYRADFQHEAGKVRDVFDGAYYQTLRSEIVPTDDENHPFFYFSDEHDIALGLSTDGFAPFKRRTKTCWPIILFNYNLPPDIRFQKRYCVNVGTIPGPKKPWDMDSFLWPLVQELQQLEVGVKSFDAISQSVFVLHAYLIIVFGDIPAMALIMRMKGSNGISPCRICAIKAIRADGSKTYYVPLHRNQSDPVHYTPSELPIRTQDELMAQARAAERAPNDATFKKLSQEYGIKGTPILSTISSISFPLSFPFDFMHLIWENLIPNLVLFWTGSFKELDHKGQDYVITAADWAAIGKATAESKATIPSAFGAPPPNIATQRSQMTSEMYCNWTLFIAPIVLQGKFKNPTYYRHFMNLVGLLKLCLALEIDEEELEMIDRGFETWVKDYERLYYQHKPERLSACPLTIHALLHIGWSIRATGPVWTYWAFPMERHCNSLLASIRSRRHPYASINTFVTATAQLDQIRLKFNARQTLCLKPEERAPKNTFIHPSYPSFQLCPPKRVEVLSQHICTKIYAALATRFGTSRAVIQTAFKIQEPVCQYGKAIRLEGGDRIVADELVQSSEDTRNASYIKYVQTVDRFARQRNQTPEFVQCIFFGQLKRLLVLEVPPIPQLLQDMPSNIIFAVIQSIKTFQENDLYYYTDLGPVEIVDLSTIKCVVGRVRDGNRWGIVDRSNVAENVLE